MPHGQVLATMYSTDMHHDTDISGGVVFICMQLHLGKAKFKAGGDLRSTGFNRPKTHVSNYIRRKIYYGTSFSCVKSAFGYSTLLTIRKKPT
jgi:hypothetical protein